MKTHPIQYVIALIAAVLCHACDRDSLAPQCQVDRDEASCVDGVTLKSCDNGLWREEPCAQDFKCEQNQCVRKVDERLCQRDSQRCLGGQLEICAIGKAIQYRDCPEGQLCQDDACRDADLCQETWQRCAQEQLTQCVQGQKATVIACHRDKICVDDQCVDKPEEEFCPSRFERCEHALWRRCLPNQMSTTVTCTGDRECRDNRCVDKASGKYICMNSWQTCENGWLTSCIAEEPFEAERCWDANGKYCNDKHECLDKADDLLCAETQTSCAAGQLRECVAGQAPKISPCQDEKHCQDNACVPNSGGELDDPPEVELPKPLKMPEDFPLVLRLFDQGPYAGSQTCWGLSLRLKNFQDKKDKMATYCFSDRQLSQPLRIVLGDWNGDARRDFALLQAAQGSCKLSSQQFQLKAEGNWDIQERCLRDESELPREAFALDLNGDARDELLLLAPSTGSCQGFELHIYDGSATETALARHCLGALSADAQLLPSNIDGNKALDLLLLDRRSNCSGIEAQLLQAHGKFQFQATKHCLDIPASFLKDRALQWPQSYKGLRQTFLHAVSAEAPCQGLALRELVIRKASELLVKTACLPSADAIKHSPVAGDFNRDGLADVALLHGPATGQAFLSYLLSVPNFGAGQVLRKPLPEAELASACQPLILDFDGDQRSDFACFQALYRRHCASRLSFWSLSSAQELQLSHEQCLIEAPALAEHGLLPARFSGQKGEELLALGMNWQSPLFARDSFSAYNQIVLQHWRNQSRPSAIEDLKLAKRDPYKVYHVQMYLVNFFRYLQMTAHLESNGAVLDELLNAAQYGLDNMTRLAGQEQFPFWLCGVEPRCGNANVSNKEYFLNSVQGGSLYSNLLEHLSSLNEPESDIRRKFRESCIEMLRSSFVLRWIKGNTVVGPNPSAKPKYPKNYTQRMTELAKPSNVLHAPLPGIPAGGSALHTFAFQDIDMFMITIAADLLSAHRNRPDWKILTEPERQEIENFLELGLEAIRIRLMPSKNGDPRDTLVHDPHNFDRYHDYRYVNVFSATQPTNANIPYTQQGVSFDVSHFRRMVNLLFSVQRYHPNQKAILDYRHVITGYTMQIIKNLLHYDGQGWPRFKNFFGGLDGWFRDQGPSINGRHIFSGGFAFWAFTSRPWREKLAEIYNFIRNAKGAQLNHAQTYLCHPQGQNSKYNNYVQSHTPFLPYHVNVGRQ